MKQQTVFRILSIITIAGLCLIQSPTDANASDFSGTWRSQGYGYLLQVDEPEVDESGNPVFPGMLFEETKISLLPLAPVTISGEDVFLGNEPMGTLHRTDDTVIFIDSDDGTVITFDLLSTPPSYDITEETDDPVANFNVLWQTFEENCALFPVTGVDWQAMYDLYRPQVTEHTTPQELFDIFTHMLTPLKDGHTNLGARIDGDVFEFNPAPTPRSIWMVERTEEMLALISSYVDGNTLHEAVEDEIYYGTIDHSIGYLNILGYEDFSESDLDAVFLEFQDAEALILDLRMNEGGSDGLACAVASRLSPQEFLGYSKQARIGGYNEFAEPTPIYITPAGVQFLDRPVIVLTSSNTVSAAEVQAMILKNPALPNVTLLGETTSGYFSNLLGKNLPNGWGFTLSNERYLADNGNYEQIGITPHIEEIGSETALDNGKDNILERALKELPTISKFQELNAFIAEQVSTYNLTGMAVAVVTPDGVAWSSGYGYANIEAQIPVTSDTPFSLASVSKVVTGTALMQAWEQGAFDLDQDINELLPVQVDNPHLEGEVISMRHLASHTSSIVDVDDDLYYSFYCPGDSEMALDVFLKNYLVEGGEWYDAETNFSDHLPGTHYEYSNIAASLAGYLMEPTTGTPLDKYSNAYIFQPLGMHNTGWFLADFEDQRRIAVPYDEDKVPITEKYFPESDQLHYGFPTWPDGQLRSSVNDIGRFLAAIMNGGELDGVRILQEDTVDMMLQPLFPEVETDSDAQAFFWFYDGNGQLIGHNGGDPGVTTLLFFHPERQIGAIVLLNEDAEPAADAVFARIMALGNPPDIPTVEPTQGPAVPEPSTLLCLSTGLVGIFFLIRRWGTSRK